MVIVDIPQRVIYTLICCVFKVICVVYKRGVYAYDTVLLKAHRMLSSYDHVQEQLTNNRCNMIGAMMAFSFYRYLKSSALPGLNDRASSYESSQKVKIQKKMYIVISRSGKFRGLMNLEKARNILNTKDECGTKNRIHRQAVYKAKHKTYGRKRPYYLLEIPLCLLTLNRLGGDVGLPLTFEAKQRIISQFRCFLNRLIEEDVIRNECQIIDYNDLVNDSTSFESIIQDSPLASDCSMGSPMLRFTWQNVGFALALQYYSNFLCRVLQDFLLRKKKWEENCPYKIFHKVIVAVPHSFFMRDGTRGLLNDGLHDDGMVDDVLHFTDHLEDVGIFEDFSYQQSVYELREDLDIRHFTAVCPNTESIDLMRDEFGWRRSVTADIREEFVDELGKLMREKYAAVCVVVDYNDCKGEKLSSKIIQLIASSSDNCT